AVGLGRAAVHAVARSLRCRGPPAPPARLPAVHPRGESHPQARLRRFPRLAGAERRRRDGHRPGDVLPLPRSGDAFRDVARRRAPIAAAILVAIVGASYGAAAWLTGWSTYRDALRSHSAYIAAVDSYRSAVRPPLWRVFDDFFVMPYHAPAINTAVTLFVAVS